MRIAGTGPAMTKEAPSRSTRADYSHLAPIQTRWADNDVYGHVNNVVYYSYFDTVVNAYLVEAGVLDIHGGEVIGLVVESGCRYFAPIAFPQALEGGLRVAYIGASSVRYDLAIFAAGLNEAVAEGRFTHVYVNRETRRPTPLPDALRAALNAVRAADRGG